MDQRDYQRELERNYRRFTERLQPLVNINPQIVNLSSTSRFVTLFYIVDVYVNNHLFIFFSALTHARYNKPTESSTLRW